MDKERINTVVNKLKNSKLTSYYIAQKTEITEATIGNYRKGNTSPTAANAKILEYFFSEMEEKNKGIIHGSIVEANATTNQSIVGDSNIQTGDNSKINYHNDSIKLLKAQIEEMKKILIEKDERIKEKDSQIKEKDSQINKLLLILSKS